MANETVNRQALATDYTKKIQQARAEIVRLDRYLKRDNQTGLNKLESYLITLQKHPAANNAQHPDHQLINNKIKATQFNLNLIARPSDFPAQQKSYIDRYDLALNNLAKYTELLANLPKDAIPAARSNTATPHIIPRAATVTLGETAIFSVEASGLEIKHYYWMSGGQKQAGGKTFRLDTQQVSLGRHEVKVSLTLKNSQGKPPILIRTHFDVIEAPSSTLFKQADIALQQKGNSITMHCGFLGQERAFYNWLADSFTSNFRKVSNGSNNPNFELNQLPAGQYRIRLGITYKGTTRRLEKRFTIGNTTKTRNDTTPSTDTFVLDVAKTFIASNSNQDSAHNAIIRYLLSTTYINSYKRAYDVIRDKNGHSRVNSPLYQVRNRGDLLSVSSSDFFIRDFMQLQTQGGSKSSPYIIGDSQSGRRQRNGLSIIDKAAESGFSDNFDQLVEKINNTPIMRQHPNKVFRFERVAHRDAIQLVPYAGNYSQFYGMAMRNVIINGNTISSTAALQGIFATDGVFQNLQITNNSIETAGKHTISISGMLSGKIDGNTDLQGNLLTADKITLYPLRIGGAANIYVMSFRNARGVKRGDADYYAYETIKGNQAIDDRRQKQDHHNASYWKNVDLLALQRLFPASFDKVKQLEKERNQLLAQMQESNATSSEIQFTRQNYHAMIKDTWNTMMLTVAEPV